MKKWILYVLKNVTLTTGFAKCSSKDFKSAAWELLVVAGFASIPLWLYPIFGIFLFDSGGESILTAIKYILEGELIIYAAALMGPLIYITGRKYGERAEPANSTRRFPFVVAFPHGLAFLLVAALLCIIGGFCIGVIRIPNIERVARPNHAGIVFLSVLFYLLALHMTFCASVYRNAMESAEPDQERRDEEKALADQLTERTHAN